MIQRRKILAAASLATEEMCKSLFRKHELITFLTIAEVMEALDNCHFDLIVCTTLFDESRMFDLLREVKANPKGKEIPFVCLKLERSKITDKLMLVALALASQSLGSVGYFDIDTYTLDPENELRIELEKFFVC